MPLTASGSELIALRFRVKKNEKKISLSLIRLFLTNIKNFGLIMVKKKKGKSPGW